MISQLINDKIRCVTNKQKSSKHLNYLKTATSQTPTIQNHWMNFLGLTLKKIKECHKRLTSNILNEDVKVGKFRDCSALVWTQRYGSIV